jgi:DNA-binding Lrp family transcriptional regulator
MLSDNHVRILQHLRHDARASLASISRSTAIPTSTVFDNYQELERGPIIKHAILLDFERLGVPLRKRYLLSAPRRERLKAFLLGHQNINNASRTGSTEAFCEAYFQNVLEIENFRTALKNAKIRVLGEYDIVEELKHEEFMPELPMERNRNGA